MSTQTKVLLDSLQALEFQPQCTDGSAPRSTSPQCEQSARWAIVRLPCHCGQTKHRVILHCDDHFTGKVLSQLARNVGILCGHCGEPVALARDYYLSWTRL